MKTGAWRHEGITRKDFIRNAGTAVLGVALGLSRLARAASPATWHPDRVIVGTGNPAIDVLAIQAAVNDPSVTRLQLVGTFDFGDGTSYPRQTVVIGRGIDIRGEIASNPSGRIVSWSTEIRGGGAILPSLFGNANSGPFKVMNHGPGAGGDDTPVRFTGISFSGWCGEAIFAEACRGLEVKACRFTSPVPTTMTVGTLSILIVTAVWGLGPECLGDFIVEDNTGIFGDYATWPDDEQLVAAVMANFSRIVFRDNEHAGHDDGLEIVYNGLYSADPSFRSSIALEDNKLTLVRDPNLGKNWPAGRGSLICIWCRHVDSIVVTGNEITTIGEGAAMSLTGDGCVVRNNTLVLAPLDPGDPATYPVGMILGYYGEFPGFPPPTTDLVDFNTSVVANNRLSGAAVLGVWTYDANVFPFPPPPSPLPPNASNGNTAYGNNLDNLTAVGGATLYLTPGTYDNVFKGNWGTVIDQGQHNLVTGYQSKTGAIGPAVSAALRGLHL